MRPIVAVLLAILAFSGCETPSIRVRPLPAPALEQPPANLPAELRQRNWTKRVLNEATGRYEEQGSCVYASLTSHLRWLHQWDVAERLKSRYGGGEYDSRLRSNLDNEGIDYDFTRRADPRFLDWASRTRRGAILWWKPSHCCTFMGWATDTNGRQYATILDNNYPEKFEFHEREQFCRLWAGYGGFALACVNDPVNPIPWKSYERIK